MAVLRSVFPYGQQTLFVSRPDARRKLLVLVSRNQLDAFREVLLEPPTDLPAARLNVAVARQLVELSSNLVFRQTPLQIGLGKPSEFMASSTVIGGGAELLEGRGNLGLFVSHRRSPRFFFS